MLDLNKIREKYKLNFKGVIHIGAHVGKEIEVYEKMNIQRVLFIEANPAVYNELLKVKSSKCRLIFSKCAIADIDGESDFYVMSGSQSSSLLAPARHLEIYPKSVVKKRIRVTTKRLTTLFDEQQLLIDDYNFVNIDIQGAELLAFKGMGSMLEKIDAINTEVEREELYKGCAQEAEVTAYLAQYGFTLVESCNGGHPSWGDNFYISRRLR